MRPSCGGHRLELSPGLNPSEAPPQTAKNTVRHGSASLKSREEIGFGLKTGDLGFGKSLTEEIFPEPETRGL